MFDDWLDILTRGAYEVSLPTFRVTGEEVGTLNGSGQVTWSAGTGVRIQAMTDGASALTGFFSGGQWVPGRLVPRSSYFTFSGRTQDGWELTSDQVPRDGFRVHSDHPGVVWDLGTSGFTLRREPSGPSGRSLRILMGPPPPDWVRVTGTEVHNEVFGGRSTARDWLTTTCGLGRVSARQRPGDWFEVLVLPNEGGPPREANSVCTAVARAFGFVLGRRCVVRGHEEASETGETRRLEARHTKATRNALPRPLGRQLDFLQNVERLLGQAIDFFLTERGERVAPYLYLCWDAADNAYPTRLAISSTCAEGLLRVAAETLGPTLPRIDPADLAAFRGWLGGKPAGFSQTFLDRLTGTAGMFVEISASDIFRDWIDRGVLGTTKEDLRAWSDTRNPLAHGRVAWAGDQEELQKRVGRHDRIQNLMNKIVLQFMGYTGAYIDYAAPGHPPAKFPAFTQTGSG